MTAHNKKGGRVRTISEAELKSILDKHGKWIRQEEGGERADLRYAYLSYAYLSSADLSYANLSSADLSSANLSYADLSSANLSYADLSYANLSYADLSSADLSSADLSSANLSYADLSSANLSYADLSSANLSYADLSEIQDDFYKVLDIAKSEALGLYDSLMRGHIDGTAYEGECACLVGTVANIRKENYRSLKIDLRPSSMRPSERWFLGILKGDTPQSNQIAEITASWMCEWFVRNNILFPNYKLVSEFDHPELFK